MKFETVAKSDSAGEVILRVRMWIEIAHKGFDNSDIPVILRVRMWIEITRSALALAVRVGHPPCEDVD